MTTPLLPMKIKTMTGVTLLLLLVGGLHGAHGCASSRSADEEDLYGNHDDGCPDERRGGARVTILLLGYL